MVSIDCLSLVTIIFAFAPVALGYILILEIISDYPPPPPLGSGTSIDWTMVDNAPVFFLDRHWLSLVTLYYQDSWGYPPISVGCALL